MKQSFSVRYLERDGLPRVQLDFLGGVCWDGDGSIKDDGGGNSN